MHIKSLVGGMVLGSAMTLSSSIVGTAQAGEETPPDPVVTWISNQPCEQEDSVNCSWNAQQVGNHHGHSFIVREFPGRQHLVCVMYQKRKYARHHDYCFANHLSHR